MNVSEIGRMLVGRWAIARGLLVFSSLVAMGNLTWWAADGVNAPLFWDDAATVTSTRDLLAHPFPSPDWGVVLLTGTHPPSAFLVHAFILRIWPSHFAAIAHVWQLLLLVLLCVTAFCACKATTGGTAALLTLGLFASWPIVPSAARQIVQDLPIGTFGLLALVLWWRGHRQASLASYGIACSLKLTAVGFLPALWYLNRRHPADRPRRAQLVMGALSLLPVLPIIIALLCGHVSPNITSYQTGPRLWAVVKLPTVSGARHFLELCVYDGRWALSLAILIAVRHWFRTKRPQGKSIATDFGEAETRTLAHALIFGALGVLVVATVFGALSLQRYLVALAMPLAWVLAMLLLRSGSSLAALCATAAILQGVLISNDLVPLLSGYEATIAAKIPGFGRSIDSRPAWMKQFVQTQADAIRFLEHKRGAGRIGADWPAYFALTEPAFGYVKTALDVRPWKPGEPTPGLDSVWVDVWKSGLPPMKHEWRREFGRRYPVVLFGLSNGKLTKRLQAEGRT